MKKRFWRVRQIPQELHYLDWAEKIKEKYFLNEEYGFAGAALTFLQGNRNIPQKDSGDERRLMLFFQNLIIYWENQVGVKITIGNERLWKQNVRIALEAALNHLTSEQEKIYFRETKLARELLEGRIKTEEQMRESRIFCRWQSGLSWEEISGIKTEAKYTDTPERIQELRHDTARQRKTELEICENRKISRQLQEEFWQNRLIYLESKESETESQKDKQPSWLKEIPDKQIELDRQRQTEEVNREQIVLQKESQKESRKEYQTEYQKGYQEHQENFSQDSNHDLWMEHLTEPEYKEKVTGDREEGLSEYDRPEHPQSQLVYLESKESETGSQEDKQPSWLKESREKQSRLQRQTEEVNKEQIALQRQTEEINRDQIVLQKQAAEVNKRKSERKGQSVRDNASDKTFSESRHEFQKKSQKEFQIESQQVLQKELQKESQKDSQHVLQEKPEEESRKESRKEYQAEHQKEHQEHQENFSQDSNHDLWIEHLTEPEYKEKVIGDREEELPEYDRPEHPQSQLVYLESKESETGLQEDKQPSWLKESREKQSRLQRQTEEVNKEQIALQRQTEEINRDQIVLQKQAAEVNKRKSERKGQSVRDNASDKTFSESRHEFQKKSQKEFQIESQQVLQKELQKESQKDSQHVLQEKPEEESRKEYQAEHQKEHQEHQENFSQDSNHDFWMEHLTEPEYKEKVTGDREEGLSEYDRPEHPQSQLVYLESKESETGSQEDKKPSWLKESREKQSRLQRQTEKVNREQIALQRQTEEINKEQIRLQKQTEKVNKEQIEIQKQAAEVNKRQSERERQSVRDNTSDKTLSESQKELQKEPQKESRQELQKEPQKESRQELPKESQKESQQEYQTEYQAEHQKEHQENFSQDSNHDLWMEHLTEPEYTEKITGDREEGLPEYDRPDKEWEEKETRLEYLKSRQDEGLPGSKEEFSALMKKQSEIISEIETRVLEAETRIKRNPVQEKISEKFVGKYSERLAEQLVEKHSERFAEQLVEKYPERFAEKLMEKHSERFTEQLVEKHPEKFAEKLAEKYPEKHTAVITNKLISEIHRGDILPVLQIRNGNIIYRYPTGRIGSPEIRFRNTHLGSPEPRFQQAYLGSPELRFQQAHSGSPEIRFRSTYSGSPEPRFQQAYSKLPGSSPLLSQPQLTAGGQLYRDAKIQYTVPESRKRNQETMRSNVSALSAQTIQAQEETRVLRKQTGYTQAALAEQEKRVDGLRKELHSQIKQVNEEVKRLIDQQKSDTSVRSLTDKVMKELQKQFRTEKIRRGY